MKEYAKTVAIVLLVLAAVKFLRGKAPAVGNFL